DDQAETVLLQLLRGAGPTGLSAMADQTRRDGLVFLRPWLAIERAKILLFARKYAEITGWQAVNDPSNYADQYTRSALRERLRPHPDKRWPSRRKILGRHAQLSQETAQILQEVANEDFARLSPSADNRQFSLAAWRKLSKPRQALVLRYWFSLHGLRM